MLFTMIMFFNCLSKLTMNILVALRTRLNRRLAKLAKWADSSADERHAEFRTNPMMSYPYRTLTKPMLYSKPIPTAEVSAMRPAKIPSYYIPPPSSPTAVKASPKPTPIV